MKKRFDAKFNRYVYEIFTGEWHATTEQNIVLRTLLGSCVSVCMRDRVSKVAGINHFMLPSTRQLEDIIYNEDARYGIHAMEIMINNMMKLGAHREGLEAKVFGGGKVVKGNLNNVAESNVEFVLAFLNMENIPIVASDLGGRGGRKIHFLPDSFTVYLKRIEISEQIKDTVAEEKKLLKKMKSSTEKESDLTLFE